MSNAAAAGIGPMGPGMIGTIHLSPRDYLANATPWCAPPPKEVPRLSTHAAIAKLKEEKCQGYAAIGRLMSLTHSTDLVDAEQSLRLADGETRTAARSVHMKDVPHVFFGDAPPIFRPSEFSPEQRRAIHMRQQDEEERRRSER